MLRLRSQWTMDLPITRLPRAHPRGDISNPIVLRIVHMMKMLLTLVEWRYIYKSLHIRAWSGSKFCNTSATATATATAMEDSTAVQTETWGLKSSFRRKQGGKNQSYSASNKTCSVRINARVEPAFLQFCLDEEIICKNVFQQILFVNHFVLFLFWECNARII